MGMMRANSESFRLLRGSLYDYDPSRAGGLGRLGP